MPSAFRNRPHRSPLHAVARAAALALAFGLAACATAEDEDLVPDAPVEQLYNEAMDELMDERYEKAANLFDEVERQHPYSVWATKGQLMSAFAHYRNSQYAEAVVTLERFIELHPAHEHVDYAYYLKALCFYERISDVARDQQMTERARTALEELVARFPDSAYAADAKPRLALVRDQLAGKEMDIGRYYQQRGHYLAAINRFRTVISDYQTTSHVPEALHRLTELYLALGLLDAAQQTAAVLGYNFPGSDWYEDSYDLLVREHRVPAAGAAAAAAPVPAAPASAPSAPLPAAASGVPAPPAGAPAIPAPPAGQALPPAAPAPGAAPAAEPVPAF